LFQCPNPLNPANGFPASLLVDGSSYIFAPITACRRSPTGHGLNVGAVYGYTTMLWKLAESLHKADGPTHSPSSSMRSAKTFRNDMYGEYKANRPPPPPDLVPQFPLIRDATARFLAAPASKRRAGSDDIIACYSKAALEQGWKGHDRLLRQGPDAAGRGRTARPATTR
jgi:DNA polymerase-1